MLHAFAADVLAADILLLPLGGVAPSLLLLSTAPDASGAIAAACML